MNSMEKARRRYYKTREFRQLPGDEQQIEVRRKPNGEWEPYAFYESIEVANKKLAYLLQTQEELR